MKIVNNNDPGFDEAWNRAVAEIKGATILYTTAFRQYDRIIFDGQLLSDDSFAVLSSSGDVLAVVPLYALKKDNNIVEYCYGKEYLRGPLMSALPGTKTFDKTCQLALKNIEALSLKKGISAHKVMIEAVELIEGRNYYNYFLDYGYTDESGVTTLIECDQPQEILWANLRKSYKPLINKAKRQYQSRRIDKDNFNFDLCEEYRKLHALVAGRATRSAESFQTTYEMIETGNAFLNLIQDAANHTVGAYLFFVQGNYALYGSAVTVRDLGSQSGVGHLGLWTGILFARQLGCKYLDLGQLLVRPDITEKEKNIDLFKQGFGGKRVTVFRATKRFEN